MHLCFPPLEIILMSRLPSPAASASLITARRLSSSEDNPAAINATILRLATLC